MKVSTLTLTFRSNCKFSFNLQSVIFSTCLNPVQLPFLIHALLETVLLCTQHIKSLHTYTHTDIALYLYRFMYRYCTTVHNFYRWTIRLYNLALPAYACVAWISCTDVHLYCSPVAVHLCCKLVLTYTKPDFLIQRLTI
jgi:hypothetical protein